MLAIHTDAARTPCLSPSIDLLKNLERGFRAFEMSMESGLRSSSLALDFAHSLGLRPLPGATRLRFLLGEQIGRPLFSDEPAVVSRNRLGARHGSICTRR